MANNMKNITGTNNAYEFSETVTASAGAEVFGTDLFIPGNVGSVVMMIRRKTGSGKFKMQATCSTRDEIFGLNGADPAEWFDWDIPGVDVNGYIDEDEIQWWVPIPGGLRLVTEADASGTTVYLSVRAQ